MSDAASKMINDVFNDAITKARQMKEEMNDTKISKNRQKGDVKPTLPLQNQHN